MDSYEGFQQGLISSFGVAHIVNEAGETSAIPLTDGMKFGDNARDMTAPKAGATVDATFDPNGPGVV